MKLMGTFTTVGLYNISNNFSTRYVPSEGAAGLILKTRSAAIRAAIRDGDNIIAVVDLQTSSTMADLKDSSPPTSRPKLRFSRRPIWLRLRLSTCHFAKKYGIIV